jgi:hypothetical protein
MMRILIQTIFLAINYMALGILPAETLRQGAFMVLEKSGDFRVLSPLENTRETAVMAGEIRSGMSEISATEDTAGYILASSGLLLFFEGPGRLSFERFDQILSQADKVELSNSESRVILELKDGKLLVDTAQFETKANIVIESSFGRLTLAEGSIIVIQITENKKRKRYNLEIECNKGKARFVDREDFPYELFTGQRLSGYSKVDSLSLGFSQLSYSAQALFRRHEAKLYALALTDLDLSRFKPHMPLLENPDVDSSSFEKTALSNLELTRPIFIKLAAPAAPTLPIRAIKK